MLKLVLWFVVPWLYIVGHLGNAFLDVFKTRMRVYFSLRVKPRHRVDVATDSASSCHHGYVGSGAATTKGIDDGLTFLGPLGDDILNEGDWEHGVIGA